MKLHSILLVLIIAFSFIACDNDYPGSLYNPDQPMRPAPVIQSVDPPGSALAGVSIVTITGTGFSSVKEENVAYFGTKAGTIIEASETSLQVQAPNEVGDSLMLRVAVAGTFDFSNEVLYMLEPAVFDFGGFPNTQAPWGLATDTDGNIYVSVTQGTQSAGIVKITPEGEKSEYVPPSILRYNGMVMNAEGYLYMVRNIRLISRVIPGGGAAENWLPMPVGTFFVDLDIDGYGYLWAVGNNANIYRVNQETKEYDEYPFAANAQSVRYYDGYVYISANTGIGAAASSDIWRFAVTADGAIGDAEKYFAFSAEYARTTAAGETARALAITFNDEGTMYVGTDGPDAILLVHPNGTWEPMYPGLIQPVGSVFAWGEGPYLYYTRGEIGTIAQRLFRIHTRKNGAPTY
jgi:sugar lactone lactonase YvrE